MGLIYNWWSWYTRLAFPESRREAITSRPLLLSAIGRSTKHAGQAQLYLTPMHAAQKKVERGIENIRRGLRAVRQTAERLLGHQPWDLLVRYIVAQLPNHRGYQMGRFLFWPGRNCFFRFNSLHRPRRRCVCAQSRPRTAS
ncbi:hypothetical protein NRY66_05845 [Acidithiobacillus ferrooxidans]|uniref:hypothetical protein n=1 Tax=Acidithiobacillus ferrooxidans TaxID=920 RepID=UPI0005A13FE1|nr:hypothetical protein [Acidithiobacillus ferrooxidans]MCR1351571.1 hypothetical protein [Acidithiobacillus ferrooxidans]